MIFGFEPLRGFYEVPMREVGANIPYEMLLYLFMFIPLTIIAVGMWQRISVWMLAKGEIHRNDRYWDRFVSFLVNSFAQTRVIRKPLAGWMHAFLFWGFLVLAMAAGLDAAHFWIGWPHLVANLYIGMSWIVDVLGFLALIGIIILAYIRYVQKPERLNDTKSSDGWVILLIVVILFTGYVIEGARIAAQIQLTPFLEGVPYEKIASPFGWLFAMAMGGMSVDSLLMWHRVLWWFHMAIAFLFIALVPYTKLWHIFASMFNYAFRDLEPSA
ncbi:MAG: respiratory nitrate reductase subunit gamma, partial [Firmicutes bacterium]|nr:respiratory nitrate reductase subunit gamma [Bacillota bacterium]